MNIYHITYAPSPKNICLHFWGCNLNCRACLCRKEIYDCHLEETRETLFSQLEREAPQRPHRFLEIEEVIEILSGIDVEEVIFMGAEATLDPQLPELARELHKRFHSHNILLTNGVKLPSMDDIDEVVFSIKARTDSLHRHYTGKSNKEILENFVALYQTGIKLRTESIFIPEYIDCPEIESIARFIAGVDRNIPYRIDAYLPIGDNPWRRPRLEEVEKAVEVAKKHLANVSCLRGDEKLRYEVVRVF
jgi:pyruvate-formate lyase-activating enzyme